MKKISLALITLLLITCVGCTSKTDANSTPEPTPAVATPTPEPTATPEPEPELNVELPPVEVTYDRQYDTNKDGVIDKAEWEAYVATHPEDLNKDMVYTVDESEKYEAQQQQEQQKPEQTTSPSTTPQPSTNQGQSQGGQTNQNGGSQGSSGGQTTRPTETTPTPTPPPAPPKTQQTTPPDDSSSTAQQVQEQLERDRQAMNEADRRRAEEQGIDLSKSLEEVVEESGDTVINENGTISGDW